MHFYYLADDCVSVVPTRNSQSRYPITGKHTPINLHRPNKTSYGSNFTTKILTIVKWKKNNKRTRGKGNSYAAACLPQTDRSGAALVFPTPVVAASFVLTISDNIGLRPLQQYIRQHLNFEEEYISCEDVLWSMNTMRSDTCS